MCIRDSVKTLTGFILLATVALAGCQTTSFTVEDALTVEPLEIQTDERTIAVKDVDTQQAEKRPESIQANNSPLNAAFVYARELERRGELDEAMDQYLKVLEEEPNQALANHRMGVVLSRKQEFDSALKYFETALHNDPDNEELLADFGHCCFLYGDVKNAENLLLKAVLSPL